ncbi:Hypothetical protein TES1_0782 [Thermococcus paralvinellae]|uniref:DUF835 domain-containing protein n=1 Tax=Thermococcus paralvinellae TaxID=582419 RepID=W0I6Y2_9EURY|nr:Hypothetical protein TES1_0782 [Thermococcus paralvinellae]
MDVIPILNFISRWVIFVVVAYKFTKTKEKGWLLLSLAFFLNAIEPENYVIKPLGLQINPAVEEVLIMVNAFLIGFILLWGAIHIKKPTSDVNDVMYFAIFSSAAYIWVFIMSTSELSNLSYSFTLKMLFPLAVYGFANMYAAKVLYAHVPKRDYVAMLFPVGMFLLGALNLTYPFTRNIEWFAPYGFLMGAIFRVIMAIGAVKFVFYPITPPRREKRTIASRNFYLFTNPDEVRQMFPNLFSENNVIMITRKDPRMFSMENDMLIYWITKIKEGIIDDNPRIFAMSPTKIDILIDLVTKGLKQGYNVVYIDAFEYLMLENGFESAFKFLLSLKDRVIGENGTLIFVVSLDALSEKQRKLIEREFTKYE